MNESLDNHAREEETHMANRPPYPGTPPWAKVFGIIVVVLLFVIMLLTGHADVELVAVNTDEEAAPVPRQPDDQG